MRCKYCDVQHAAVHDYSPKCAAGECPPCVAYRERAVRIRDSAKNLGINLSMGNPSQPDSSCDSCHVPAWHGWVTRSARQIHVVAWLMDADYPGGPRWAIRHLEDKAGKCPTCEAKEIPPPTDGAGHD